MLLFVAQNLSFKDWLPAVPRRSLEKRDNCSDARTNWPTDEEPRRGVSQCFRCAHRLSCFYDRLSRFYEESVQFAHSRLKLLHPLVGVS